MTGELLILAIETSCGAGSTALLRGDEVLAEERFDPAMRGGNLLYPGVMAVLGSARGAIPDLVAVGIGPGSFTGARIGVVFAKAYAFARSLPLAGVCALEAVALRACPTGRAALLMAAHPGSAYAATYECRPGAPPGLIRAPALVPRDAFLAGLDTPDRVIELPPEQPWASDIGRVAHRRAQAGLSEPAWDLLEPLYLQPPAPERVR